MQVGRIAAWKADQRYDSAAKGYSFHTYCVWHVRRQMQRWMEENSRTIAVPSYRHYKGRYGSRERDYINSSDVEDYPQVSVSLDVIEAYCLRYGGCAPSAEEVALQHLYIAALLDSLDPVQQRALLLTGWYGCSIEEAAIQSGKSKRITLWYIGEARKKVAKRFGVGRDSSPLMPSGR